MPLHVLTATQPLQADQAALPPSLMRGSLHRSDIFDQPADTASHFWRTTLVNNWARIGGVEWRVMSGE